MLKRDFTIILLTAIASFVLFSWQAQLEWHAIVERALTKVSASDALALDKLNVINPLVVKNKQIELPKPPEVLAPLTSKNGNDTMLNVSERPEEPPIHAQAVVKAKSKNNSEQIDQIYNDILNDRAGNIRIAWPENKKKREHLFKALYQCVGMRFGVLDKGKITLAKKEQVFKEYSGSAIGNYSEWVRVSSGYLHEWENNWLSQYQLIGQPIRVLPKNIDWTMSRFISHQLKGENLQDFSGEYLLADDELHIVNIHLNKKALHQKWLLAANVCR